MYTAIDAAGAENGCVQLVPKSHKNGVINRAHHSAFLTEVLEFPCLFVYYYYYYLLRGGHLNDVVLSSANTLSYAFYILLLFLKKGFIHSADGRNFVRHDEPKGTSSRTLPS